MKRLFVRFFALAVLVSAGFLPCWASSVDREVVIANPAEHSVLAGTLSMPETSPKAALVLATGSGQQDRDETVFGHKPFKVIADSLSSYGYAVLRLDDRGVGGSTGEVENATTANFASDINRALCWLDSVLVNVPVGVLGHSEGGQIAYRVAVAQPKCRFIITLAAPAWPGDSLVMAQCRALSVKALGTWPGEKNQRAILDAAMSDMPAASARFVVMSEVGKAMGDAAKMPQMQEYIVKQAELVLSPWYRAFLRYDPSSDIESVTVPWLAMNGSLDTQVIPENLATIKQLCPSAVTVEMNGHNHLFQKASSGLPNEYETIAEDISAETIGQILPFLDSLSGEG